MSKRIRYEVSKDGKTVTAGGKIYSIGAFKNQFGSINPAYVNDRTKALAPTMVGSAEPTGKKVVTPKVDSSPEAAKKRAEKKAQKAGLKALNKAGLGQKLTEPKPAAGKTRIGGLGTGRGAISGLGGGGLMDVNR